MQINEDRAVSTPFQLKIDSNVLNHLGLNLYSNVPAVLAELIANSWDADATRVDATVIREADDIRIIIQDNGCGMDDVALRDKYLTVGYERRKNGMDKTEGMKRRVMGRKGIGKLSALSIAENIQIITKENNGGTLSIEMDVAGIKDSIRNKKIYEPQPVKVPSDIELDSSGTVLILTNLKKRVYASLDSNLRQRIARRFSIFSDTFQVFIDGKQVMLTDRNYFSKLEFALHYGDFDISKFSHDRKNVVRRDNNTVDSNATQSVNGWVGLVEKSGDLQSGSDNLNKISVLTRGKIALEDILESYREGGLYTKYVIGEIEADFLDSTDEDDIATSSRQDFIQGDERFINLRMFIKNELAYLKAKRAKLKGEQGEKKALEIPAIKAWFESLRGDTKKSAKNLFANLNQIAIDDNHRKSLYQHGVLAFEYLRHREMLNELDQLESNNLEEVVNLFIALDDIEATWYYRITKGRLDVIKKLSQHVDQNALENIIQSHIYDHLWLLDPSWDRATETPTMERSVTNSFKNISNKLTDEEQRGRIDIRYKKTAGKHVIVELKRSSVTTSTDKIWGQVDKYISALKKQARETCETEAVEVVCIVGKELQDWDSDNRKEESVKALAARNIRVVTYQELIKDAELQYQQYLENDKERGRIQTLLDEIEGFDYLQLPGTTITP